MRTKSVLSKKLLSPTEVAERLSIPSKKVFTLIKSGALPCFRFGDQIRVDVDDLAAFIQAKREG
jgi:excisionase family DNA binding protein